MNDFKRSRLPGARHAGEEPDDSGGALPRGWEWLNFLLPPVLQKISVIHHLQSLCPLPIPRGPFALPAEPTPPILAVPGVLVLAALLLWVAARRARRLEVAYAAE